MYLPGRPATSSLYIPLNPPSKGDFKGDFKRELQSGLYAIYLTPRARTRASHSLRMAVMINSAPTKMTTYCDLMPAISSP